MKWKGSDLQVVLRKVLQSKPPKHNVQNLRFGSSRFLSKNRRACSHPQSQSTYRNSRIINCGSADFRPMVIL